LFWVGKRYAAAREPKRIFSRREQKQRDICKGTNESKMVEMKANEIVQGQCNDEQLDKN